jgi:hypothetical protein
MLAENISSRDNAMAFMCNNDFIFMPSNVEIFSGNSNNRAIMFKHW